MVRKRNRYKNSLGVFGLIRWVLVVTILGITGSSYVYIKNQHVVKSNLKKSLEEEIKALDREIETTELRSASMMDRVAIQRKLDFTGSNLRKINPMVVERIIVPDQSPAYAVEHRSER